MQSMVHPPPGHRLILAHLEQTVSYWADAIAGAGRRHRRDPGLSASGSAAGLHKRGDNPVYRARVLEVRIFLQQTVRLSPDFAFVPGKARVLRQWGSRPDGTAGRDAQGPATSR